MSWLWKFLIGSLPVLGAFFVVLGGAHAQEPTATGLMAEANARYDRGERIEAAQLYEALVGRGYQDTALYYNLANAYLEAGDLGRAVLNYLRAEELSPRDPDVLTNLELARGRTVDRLEAEGDSLVASIADLGRRWATTGEFGIVALALWAVVAAACSVLILAPAVRLRVVLRSGAVVAFLLMLVSLTLTLSMIFSNPYENSGVVTVPTAGVLTGPGPQYAEAFALHSGAQVRLVGSRHGWLQVALPGGELQGWVPAHAIEAVGRSGG